MQKTLIILKPDCVARGLTGEVTTRFEKKWLKLVASKMGTLSEEILKEHYAHIADKPFFPSIVTYMQSAPVMMQIWEWDDVIDVVRLMIWVTNPTQAQPGTVRGDFAISINGNIIHASENQEASDAEISRFFSSDEMHTYTRADESFLYE